MVRFPFFFLNHILQRRPVGQRITVRIFHFCSFCFVNDNICVCVSVSLCARVQGRLRAPGRPRPPHGGLFREGAGERGASHSREHVQVSQENSILSIIFYLRIDRQLASQLAITLSRVRWEICTERTLVHSDSPQLSTYLASYLRS